MSNLKSQQKKLLNDEITSKVMEYLMGLDEELESLIRKLTARHVKKVVKAYYHAIKSRRKKALKATTKEKEVVEVVLPTPTAAVAFEGQTNLIAS